MNSKRLNEPANRRTFRQYEHTDRSDEANRDLHNVRGIMRELANVLKDLKCITVVINLKQLLLPLS